MTDPKTRRAALLRERATRVRAAAETLAVGAEDSPRPGQQDLLRIQARILAEGAARMEEDALAIEPAKGSA